MSAPVYSIPENPQQEIVDFLRRLSSMLTGGRNAEMLQEAAAAIEALSRRAASAEALFQEQQEDHARNLELREVAELASDNLMSEVESLKAEIDLLKAQLRESQQQLDERQRQLDDHRSQHEIDRNHFAEETQRQRAMMEISEAALAEADAERGSLKAEIDLLKTQLGRRQQELEDRQSQHEIDRNHFAGEALRQQAMTEVMEARLAEARAEIEELRKPAPAAAFDDSIAVVPVQSLQLARTQFDYLARGFADKGDIVALTICEIGARAIDKALADDGPAGGAT